MLRFEDAEVVEIVMLREDRLAGNWEIGRPGSVEGVKMTKYGRLFGEKWKYFTTSNAGTTVSAARKTSSMQSERAQRSQREA